MPGVCHRCHLNVYLAEERLALDGHSWHFECFTCAICNKSLDSSNVTECRQTDEIYCRNCYRKYFGTPGYGYGPNEPTLLTVLPPAPPPVCDDLNKEPIKITPQLPRPVVPLAASFSPPPSRRGQEFSTMRPTPVHYVNMAVRKRAECEEVEQGRKSGQSADIRGSIPADYRNGQSADYGGRKSAANGRSFSSGKSQHWK